jgi:hypothetical protein
MVAAVLALVASGCSLVATTGAPDQIAGPRPPDCTTSKVPVYVDSAIGVGAVGTSLFIGLAALASSGRRETLGYATLFTFLTSIPFTVSGIIGGARVRSCRKARDAWRATAGSPTP